MYNKKEILKLLVLIIAVLSIPLLFISVEIVQSMKVISTIDPNEIIDSSLDKLYKEISTAPKNSDASIIRKCLTEIIDLMNAQDYDSLYSLLTDDIKEALFPTKESFSEYMEIYLKGEKYSPKFSSYKKLNKEENPVYIVNVSFLPYSTKEEDITSENSEKKTDTFTIYLHDDLTYKFSFMSYIGQGQSNHKFENDNFICRIVKTHLYLNKTTFVLKITNKTDEDIFINSDEIYVHTGLMPKYYSSLVYVPQNSSETIQFTIYTGLSLKASLPYKIYFEGVHVGNKVTLFYLPIKYPVKISSMHI